MRQRGRGTTILVLTGRRAGGFTHSRRRKAHARDRGGGHHRDRRETRRRGDPLPARGRRGSHPRRARNGALAPRRADHRRDPGERGDRAGADAAPLPGHRHGRRPRGAGAGRARDRWLPAGRHQRRDRAGVRRGLPAQVDRGAPVRRPEEHGHEHPGRDSHRDRARRRDTHRLHAQGRGLREHVALPELSPRGGGARPSSTSSAKPWTCRAEIPARRSSSASAWGERRRRR